MEEGFDGHVIGGGCMAVDVLLTAFDLFFPDLARRADGRIFDCGGLLDVGVCL